MRSDSTPEAVADAPSEIATTESPVSTGEEIVAGSNGTLTLLYNENGTTLEVDMVENVPAHESEFANGHCIVSHDDWEDNLAIPREELEAGVKQGDQIIA